MRSRTVREGSVGLLFLAGLGLFVGLSLWLRGVYFGKTSYKAIIEFANAAGMQEGTPVRYRGVTVGKVTDIKAKPNGVDVEIEITEADLAISRENLVIEANQSGLIGENTIDIRHSQPITAVRAIDPLRNCNPNLIICDNARLKGDVGVSLDELIRVTVRFANLYTDPQFFANVNSVVQNTSTAARGVTELTRDLSSLTASVKQELSTLSRAANTVGQTAAKFGTTVNKFNQTADRISVTTSQIGAVTTQTANKFSATADRISAATNLTANRAGVTFDKLGRTADRFSVTASQLNTSVTQTANKFGATAEQFRATAGQVNSLVTDINSLVKNNQSSLVLTLDNLSQTSTQLRGIVSDLAPAVNRVTQGELIRNLETLSANAAQASTNLRDLSNNLNSPTNLLVLQQTLDSARVTFQNAQKITSDLDDLTGDPAFRTNLRNLVNGLSGLVSSTEQLQQQVEVAQYLAPMQEVTNMSPKLPEFQMEEVPVVNLSIPLTSSNAEEKPKPSVPQPTAARTQKKPLAKKSASIEAQPEVEFNPF